MNRLLTSLTPTNPRSLFAAGVLVLLFVLSGCRPFAGPGDSCLGTPCESGLRCMQGICSVVVDPPEPEPEAPTGCTTNRECAVGGSADGRACVDGECLWIDCSDDAACGERVCEDGQCAEREECNFDDECKEDRICVEGVCRPPCQFDDECGGLLAACVEGRCTTTCFIDLMCGTDICLDGVCTAPDCVEDGDCEGDNIACEAGRCEEFTPCEEDDDCFDPDFLCNELGRCEARATCSTDAQCGGAELCIGDVCRPTEACALDDDCPDVGDECVVGVCVPAPGCREDGDCGLGEVCANLACSAEEIGTATEVSVQTAHGVCEADGTGPCRLMLFPGELASIAITSFDEEGARVAAPYAIESKADGVASVTTEGVIEAKAAGRTQISVNLGEVSEHRSLIVDVVPQEPSADLVVLVVDGKTGEAVEGASVRAGGSSALTGDNGRAVFLAPPAPDAAGVSGLVVTHSDFVGVARTGVALSGRLRVLMDPVADNAFASGLRVSVLSTGDETGPVGYGLALASSPSVVDADYDSLFGGAVTGSLEVQIIGGLPVELPQTATLEAALPLGTSQIVRGTAFVPATGGRRVLTAFESRRDNTDLLGTVFGGDHVEFALDLAEDAEGSDILLRPLGRLADRALVADTGDFDGDGNVTELVPDYFNFPDTEVYPERRPLERVGIDMPPANLPGRTRLLVVAGQELSGLGFVISGLLAFTPQPEPVQLKVVPPVKGRTDGPRALRVEALLDDPAARSYAVWRGSGFAPTVEVAPLMAPPDGAFVLDGVPAPGTATLVLPQTAGASAFLITLQNGANRVVLAAPSGANVGLPAALFGPELTVVSLTALRLDTPAPVAIASTMLVGEGPRPRLIETAQAVSVQNGVGP